MELTILFIVFVAPNDRNCEDEEFAHLFLSVKMIILIQTCPNDSSDSATRRSLSPLSKLSSTIIASL